MPHFVPPVPLAKRTGAVSSSAAAIQKPFPAPVLWMLGVLAWLAFGVASYLAWQTITQSQVAGCDLGPQVNCDMVLSSSWSKWLGIPVAILGLACYATLATISVLLVVRHALVIRWLSTIFVMLSLVAVAASFWFLGIQVFALGKFCIYCLVADSCGIALGLIATAFAIRAAVVERSMPKASAQAGLMALRTAIPGGARSAPLAIAPEPTRPRLIFAFAGAAVLIVLLVGGQLLFPTKMFVEKKPTLNQSITMVGSDTDAKSNDSGTGKTRVAMRIPTEGEDVRPTDSQNPAATTAGKENSSGAPDRHTTPTSNSNSPASDSLPARKRLVKFLGGKLTLDVYEHAVIGSPEAPHIVVEMISYDCPHCRKMYPTVQRALERYGDQVALLVMPVPFETECNKLIDSAHSQQGACSIARMALGIARVNPPEFSQFHEFLMATKDKPPPMDAILPKAYMLADRSRVRELTHGEQLNKQIAGYVDLFDQLQKQNQANKKFGLPIQILGDFVVSGSIESEADVFKAWEEHLGVKPK
jgi:uncharacterized membrane protein/thiol-disulfide isomerase/thioredoxin